MADDGDRNPYAAPPPIEEAPRSHLDPRLVACGRCWSEELPRPFIFASGGDNAGDRNPAGDNRRGDSPTSPRLCLLSAANRRRGYRCSGRRVQSVG